MKCKYCGHTMNSLGGISTLAIPPTSRMNYECRYCGAKCSHTYQEAFRADDPPRTDEISWKEPPVDRLKEVLDKEHPANPQPETPPTLALLEAAIESLVSMKSSGRAAWESYQSQVAAIVRDNELATRDLSTLRTDYALMWEENEKLRKVLGMIRDEEYAYDQMPEVARRALLRGDLPIQEGD